LRQPFESQRAAADPTRDTWRVQAEKARESAPDGPGTRKSPARDHPESPMGKKSEKLIKIIKPVLTLIENID
jgi:hypothetical protein